VLQQLSKALTIPEETLRKKIRRGLVRLRTIAEGGDADLASLAWSTGSNRAATWALEEGYARQFVERMRTPGATKTEVLKQLSEALTIPEETLRKKIRRGKARLGMCAEGHDVDQCTSPQEVELSMMSFVNWDALNAFLSLPVATAVEMHDEPRATATEGSQCRAAGGPRQITPAADAGRTHAAGRKSKSARAAHMQDASMPVEVARARGVVA
jgi:hypothetical protein